MSGPKSPGGNRKCFALPYDGSALDVWKYGPHLSNAHKKNIQKLIFIAAGSHTQLIRIFNKEMLEYEKKLSFANKKRLLLLFVTTHRSAFI